MISVLILGIFGGTDSLQVASAMGMAGMKRHRRLLLAASLVFFDTLMTLVGLMIGHGLSSLFEKVSNWLAPVCILALGIYIVVREFTETDNLELVNKRWLLIVLPLAMSIDNLFAGLGLGTARYPIISTALILGLCSGLMCLVGHLIGSKLRNMVPDKMGIIGGLYLVGLAIYLLIEN